MPDGLPVSTRRAADAERRVLPVPTHAGEGLLIHNQLWHRLGVNRTGRRRSAISFCYMSAATRCVRKKRAPRQFRARVRLS